MFAELKAAGNPKLPQAAVDDLLAQVSPASSCFGNWGSCSCQIELLP